MVVEKSLLTKPRVNETLWKWLTCARKRERVRISAFKSSVGKWRMGYICCKQLRGRSTYAVDQGLKLFFEQLLLVRAACNGTTKRRQQQ